ncbi:MAG: metallophosphoesterase [Halioglobus sp.]
MPQRFAQLSDPHLSSLQNVRARDLLSKRALGYLSWRRRRRFEHQTKVLDALLCDLEQATLEQVLVTGDLTHIGLPSEFAQARDWLQQLGTPDHVALVPGNHDACVAAPWDDTFALWQDYMLSDGQLKQGSGKADFPTLRVRGDIAFIGLSTACPTPPLMATGTLGEAQVQALPALLQRAADDNLFRVVYLHHCPISGQEKWRKRLTDAPQIQAVLQEYGAELVLHGHGHRGHFSELQTRCGQLPVIAVPSASALGLHGADIAHYNRYEVERQDGGWQLRIDTRRYQSVPGEFAAGESRTLRIARS